MVRIVWGLIALLAAGYGSHRLHTDLNHRVDQEARASVSAEADAARYRLFLGMPRSFVALSSAAPAATATPPPGDAIANATHTPAANNLEITPSTRLPRIDRTERQRYAPLIQRVARRYNVEAALIHAVISAESAYDPYAVSPRGASGLMQLMPDTADHYGVVDIYDPSENVVAGTKHLRYLMRLFDNNVALALAAYNAGHNTVIKYGHAIPPFRETLDYVPRVLGYYQKYQQGI